jgi:hypothetical protein
MGWVYYDDIDASSGITAGNTSDCGIVHGWARFAPAIDSLVGSATLEFYLALTGTPSIIVYAADADDQANPASWSDYNSISVTSASLLWEPTENGVVVFMDVTDLVKEVVSRLGFTASSHIVFLFKDNGSSADEMAVIPSDINLVWSLPKNLPLTAPQATPTIT